MAYVSQDQNDDSDALRNQNQIFGSANQLAGGVAGSNPGASAGALVNSFNGSSGGNGGAWPSSTANGTSGSGGSGGGQYVNFSNYLNANKDSAQRSANQVASTVGGEASTATQGLQGVQNAFGGAVAAGSPYNALPFQQAGQNNMGLTLAGASPGAPPAPGGQGLTSAQAQQLSQQTYTGPNQLSEAQGFQPMLDQYNQATNDVQALGTQGGLSAMLGQAGNTNQGQNLFNAGLVGAAGNQQFSDLSNQYGGLQKALSDAYGNAATQASNERQDVAKTAAAYGAEVPALQASEAAAAKQKTDAASQQSFDQRGDYNSQWSGKNIFGNGGTAPGITATGPNGQSVALNQQTYDSMTPDQWAQWQGMSGTQRYSYGQQQGWW